jgi:hypothetical protein
LVSPRAYTFVMFRTNRWPHRRAPRCCCSPTIGRDSGAKRNRPLMYQPPGDDYLVVASATAAIHPGWFLNLQDDPIVAAQVKADREIPVVVLEPG